MKIHHYKKVIDVFDVDTEKILVSNEFAYSKNKETNAKFIG